MDRSNPPRPHEASSPSGSAEQAQVAKTPFLRYLPLLLFVALGLALLASGVTRYLNLRTLSTHEAQLRDMVGAHQVLALAAFAGAYAVATATSLPGATVLTLAGGFLFGTWLGGGASVVGATVGAIVVFLVVRSSLGAWLRERAERSGGRLKSVIDGVADGAFGYILALRLMPFAPFWLVNVAAALAGAPLRAYAAATVLGILPATFIYSGIGAGIGKIVAGGQTPNLMVLFEPQLLLPLVALALFSLATTIFQRVRARSEAAN